MSDDEYEHLKFTNSAVTSPLTYPMKCSALRKKGHVVIDGRPCEIIDLSTSETGEVKLVGLDVFTGRRYNALSWPNQNMDVPYISYQDYSVVDISDDCLTLMLDDGTTRDDIQLPDGELGLQLEGSFQSGTSLIVTVVSTMSQEQALTYKAAPKS
ncbi:hypothetical protein MBANPS3_004914 [Mucor bainieri]